MADSVHKVVEVVGTSNESISKAIGRAISTAGTTLRHLGWFEVVRDLFERLTAEHGLAPARPDADEATVSFAAVIGREPDIVVAHQARLADLIVLSHPAGDKGYRPQMPFTRCCLIRQSPC
jgi:hypothetical protein